SVFSISVPVSAPCRRGRRRSQARRVQRGSSSDFSLVLLFVPCGALFLFATSALYDPRRRLQARLPPRIRELAAHDRVEDAPREGLALEGRPPGARREIGALDRHGLSLEDRERAGVARLEPAVAVGKITAEKATGVLARDAPEILEREPLIEEPEAERAERVEVGDARDALLLLVDPMRRVIAREEID